MNVLVIAEMANGGLAANFPRIVTAARQLGPNVTVLVAAHGDVVPPVAAAAAQWAGVTQVLTATAPHYADGLAEELAPLLAQVGRDYDVLLMSTSTTGKNLLPRAAALLDIALVSEVLHIHDAHTFDRPIYAGNLVATVRVDGRYAATVRPTVFPPAEMQAPATITAIAPTAPVAQSRLIARQSSDANRPELTAAKVVVAGGRGLQDAAGFQQLEQLADHWAAAIGATRAAVDAGLAPNDWQIGQTGKVIAPDLYVAVGISGAIQHLAGIKDSKVIAAINADPDAPIFQIADVGLVADARLVLPQLCATPRRSD